mmetsp:Transcript_17722/g.71139  ORF Transcript_17722/g.71139 Transcript_17722/m.71139 type:complete len:204 (+) Transcript_17722:105-716(+)
MATLTTQGAALLHSITPIAAAPGGVPRRNYTPRGTGLVESASDDAPASRSSAAAEHDGPSLLAEASFKAALGRLASADEARDDDARSRRITYSPSATHAGVDDSARRPEDDDDDDWPPATAAEPPDDEFKRLRVSATDPSAYRPGVGLRLHRNLTLCEDDDACDDGAAYEPPACIFSAEILSVSRHASLDDALLARCVGEPLV